MSFATWDATRKGSGVTLSGGNLTATISGLFMVAASNAVDISGSTGYYAEFTGIATGTNKFIGIGPAKSNSSTSSYLGSAANQYCMWQDGSDDTVSGITRTGNLWNYTSARTAGIKIAVKGNKLWIGGIGLGWRNPTADNFTADPTAGTNFILSGFTAGGLWSLAVSSIDVPNGTAVTANFGASSWVDTPPSGFVGWPGASGTVVNLTGVSATAAAGTLAGRSRISMSGLQATGAAGILLPKARLPVSGVAASAAIGTVSPRIKPALLGVAASAAIGVVSPVFAVRISSVSAASGVGSFAPAVGAFLTGLFATGAVGELEPPGSTSVSLSGVQASASVGTLAPRIKIAIDGIQGAAGVGSVRARFGAIVSGVVATSAVGHFGVSIWPTLTGVQANTETGLFAFAHPDPKLVSVTFTNVGLACTTTITNAGLRGTTTFTDMD